MASCSVPTAARRSGATWFSAGEASIRFGAPSTLGSCSIAWTAAGSAEMVASASRGWIAQPNVSRSMAVRARKTVGQPRHVRNLSQGESCQSQTAAMMAEHAEQRHQDARVEVAGRPGEAVEDVDGRQWIAVARQRQVDGGDRRTRGLGPDAQRRVYHPEQHAECDAQRAPGLSARGAGAGRTLLGWRHSCRGARSATRARSRPA